MEINIKKHKTVVLVQARENSIRFPKKVLYKINGKSIIQIIVSRLSKSKNVDKIIVAIPNNKKNKNLEKHLKEKKIKFFKGSEHDVLKRFYKIAKKIKAQNIVRVTGDCPLVDPFLIDKIV